MQTCKLKQISAEYVFALRQYLFLNNFLYRQAHCCYRLQRAIPKSLTGFVIPRSWLNLSLPLVGSQEKSFQVPQILFMKERWQWGKGAEATSLEMPEILAGDLRAVLPCYLQHQ